MPICCCSLAGTDACRSCHNYPFYNMMDQWYRVPGYNPAITKEEKQKYTNVVQTPRCEICKYFVSKSEESYPSKFSFGECRYDPPRIPETGSDCPWPTPYKSDWCGKFEGKR